MIARNVEAAERAARLAAFLVATLTNGPHRAYLTAEERDTLTERGDMLHAIADDLEDVRYSAEGRPALDQRPPAIGALADVEAHRLPALVALGPVLLDRDDQAQGFERFAEVLAAEVDEDGRNGGDPGDIVLSLPGDGAAYAPSAIVRIVRVDAVHH